MCTNKLTDRKTNRKKIIPPLTFLTEDFFFILIIKSYLFILANIDYLTKEEIYYGIPTICRYTKLSAYMY